MEKALRDWCTQLNDWGFPPRLDLLRGMAEALTHVRAEEENKPDLAGLGKQWSHNFLKRNPNLQTKLGTQLDRQRAYASTRASPPGLRHQVGASGPEEQATAQRYPQHARERLDYRQIS